MRALQVREYVFAKTQGRRHVRLIVQLHRMLHRRNLLFSPWGSIKPHRDGSECQGISSMRETELIQMESYKEIQS